MRWWHLRGVRARTTLSATLVVAVALALAGAGLVVLQRQQLINGLTEVARQQGAEVAAQITDGGAQSVDATAVSATVGEPALLQVIEPDGSISVASSNVTRDVPVTDAVPAAGQSVVQTVDQLPKEENEPFVVVTTGVDTPGGLVRVVTAQSLETVERSTKVLLALLVIGYPIVLVLVSGASYWLAGHALAPVEGIRRQVSRISAADQTARVPVPDSGDEIARLAQTMNTMLSRLQAAAEAQRRFVADASHELRSPLATIRATTELSRSHPGALDHNSAAEQVLVETDRLERLVADLLLLARSDEDGLVMRMQDVDLDDIVTEEVARLRASKDIAVVVDVRSVRVCGDAPHLVRAVRNLTDNAARYATTAMEVRLRATADTAYLDVVDDGPGIPEAERQRVFERFVRLDASRERCSGGTGLGLAITRQIARAHGGDVHILQREGGSGAHLSLTLPLPDAPDGPDGPDGHNRVEHGLRTAERPL